VITVVVLNEFQVAPMQVLLIEKDPITELPNPFFVEALIFFVAVYSPAEPCSSPD
jgi:hypothetical protein